MLGKYVYADVKELLGKTIIKIANMEKDCGEITFICSDGSQFLMEHDQDCCESVFIEDVCGDVKDLLNSPILMAEDISNDCHMEELSKYDESYTWTWYKFATIKGYVTLRWYGTSNGYYSESVDFKRLERR